MIFKTVMFNYVTRWSECRRLRGYDKQIVASKQFDQKHVSWRRHAEIMLQIHELYFLTGAARQYIRSPAVVRNMLHSVSDVKKLALLCDDINRVRRQLLFSPAAPADHFNRALSLDTLLRPIGNGFVFSTLEALAAMLHQPGV